MKGGSLRSRYAISIGGRVIGALAQTAVIALLARSLGTEYFGTFAVVLGVLQVAYTVADLGFSTRVLQLQQSADTAAAIGAMLVLRVSFVLLALTAGVVLLLTLPMPTGVIAAAVVIYATGEALGDLLSGIFQGELKPARAVAVLVGRRLIALAPFAFGLSTESAIASILTAGLLGHVLFWPTASRRAGRPLGLRAVLKSNGPITLATTATSFTQADSALVSTVAGSALTSSYAAASRLANPVNLAVATMLQVLIPEFSRLGPAARVAQFVRARRLVLVLAVAVAASAFLSPLIVSVLYGAAFAASAPILAGVLVGAGLSAVSRIHFAFSISHGLTVRDAVWMAASVAVGLAALTTSSAIGGATGCAVGYVLMEAAILVGVYSRYRATLRRSA